MPTPSQSRRVGVTLGDPSGIGPEIVARALRALPAHRLERIVLFGDKIVLSRAFRSINKEPLVELSTVASKSLNLELPDPGCPNEASAQAQVDYLEAAVEAALAGEIGALATAPINKSAAQSAGFAFPGHTEFLAARLGAEEVAMMFAGPRLKVVLATVHEAIVDLGTALTCDRIRSAIRLAALALREDFGIDRPRIGVLGLNPHAGEGGCFGDEEERVIEPAIRQANEELAGMADLVGPLVPDAAFRMDFDCFVAMYHDQGLIPVKLIDFDESVNMTLGLPIVRTSPDHGVAYDIAGTGRARATSMSAAIDLAFHLMDRRASSHTQRETRAPKVS